MNRCWAATSTCVTRSFWPGTIRAVASGSWRTSPAPAQTRPTVSELRSYLQGELPAYMVPAVFVMLDALPLRQTGKSIAEHCRRQTGLARSWKPPFVAGRTEAERRIATIWKEAIGIDKVGIDDNFFEAGGDSLIMIEVQWKLQEAFDSELTSRADVPESNGSFTGRKLDPAGPRSQRRRQQEEPGPGADPSCRAQAARAATGRVVDPAKRIEQDS